MPLINESRLHSTTIAAQMQLLHPVVQRADLVRSPAEVFTQCLPEMPGRLQVQASGPHFLSDLRCGSGQDWLRAYQQATLTQR